MNETDIEIIRAIDLPEYEGNPKDAKMLVTTPEGVKQMSGEAYPQLDTTTAAEGDIPVVGEGGNLVGSGIKAENIAQKDGYYAQLTAGAAENLVGQTPDKEAYLIRPTGGEGNEVANGIASVVGAEGNSCVWNQLFTRNIETQTARGVTFTKNNDGSYTVNGTATGGSAAAFNTCNIVSGHKYYIPKRWESEGVVLSVNNSSWSSSKTGVFTATNQTKFIIGVTEGVTVDNIKVYPFLINLTLLGIDNLTTVSQVEAWLAQHVGTKPYYAYNAGTILSAQTLGIKTYGQNLLNPTTKQAKLIPYTWVENGTTYSNQYTIKDFPSGATATFTPDNTGVAETVDISGGSLDITSYGSGVLELSAATTDTYVCMKWNGTKDDDVVPYEDHTYDFDVRKVYGKVNGAGEYVQCFPNGMKSAGTAKDSLTAAGATKVIEDVNLGSLIWADYSSARTYAVLSNSKYVGKIIQPNLLCANYQTYSYNDFVQDKGITLNYDAPTLRLRDSLFENLTGQQIQTSLNGVHLQYELATPITYTDLVYRDNGIDRPLSEVLINMEVDNWGIEQQLVTPYEDGNPTSIPATLSTIYSMDAVEAIDTLQKTTYTEAEVHDNLAALLACVNTNCSEVLGGTFAVSDTATDKVFEFTFTPTPEPTDNSNE